MFPGAPLDAIQGPGVKVIVDGAGGESGGGWMMHLFQKMSGEPESGHPRHWAPSFKPAVETMPGPVPCPEAAGVVPS